MTEQEKREEERRKKAGDITPAAPTKPKKQPKSLR